MLRGVNIQLISLCLSQSGLHRELELVFPSRREIEDQKEMKVIEKTELDNLTITLCAIACLGLFVSL